MTNVLILGANGQLARNTTRVFLRDTDAKLTLYLRRASRLSNPAPARVSILEGDVLDLPAVARAMNGQDEVYANYTILRPRWFTRDAAIDYRITQKGDPFRGHDVSLNSVSDLIVKLALNPMLEIRRSLGVSNG